MFQDTLVPNVGRIDAIARGLLGAGLLATMLVFLPRLDPDWAPTLLIHSLILAAYLLLTSVARSDLFYHVFGWDSRSRRVRRAREASTRPPPSGGRRRPQA